MGRTYVKGSQVLDGDITDLDLANGAVTGPKLGIGALIGTDIQPFSEALLGVERIFSINTNKNLLLQDQGLQLITASISNLIMNLPIANTVPNARFIFKRLDSTSRTVTISAGGTDLIDTTSSRQLIQNEWIEVQSNGLNWIIRNEGPPKIELPNTSSGVPGYSEPGIGIVSIDRDTHAYGRHEDCKNVYLSNWGGEEDLDNGIPLVRDAYIVSIIATTSKNTHTSSYFYVRVLGNSTNLYTLTMPNNSKYVRADNIWFPMNKNDQVRIYFSSSKKAEDVYCQIEWAWR